MPPNHFILCCPLLLPSSIVPIIRIFFSKDSFLCIRWPKYWSFSFNISLSNECSGLISFRIDWFDLLTVHIKGRKDVCLSVAQIKPYFAGLGLRVKECWAGHPSYPRASCPSFQSPCQVEPWSWWEKSQQRSRGFCSSASLCVQSIFQNEKSDIWITVTVLFLNLILETFCCCCFLSYDNDNYQKKLGI